MKQFVVAGAALCAALVAGSALADVCNGLAAKLPPPRTIDAKGGNSALESLTSKLRALIGANDALKQTNASSSALDEIPLIECDSIEVAIRSLVNAARPGGRGLEPPAPLDRSAAQAELDAAVQKDAVKQALDAIRQKVADEDVRLFLEAAVFDADGSYRARDLRLTQLREKLGA